MTTNQEPDPGNSLVISYLLLRKAVGWLGIALPTVLAFGAMLLFETGFQSSISSYYYTGMRDVYVGTLCAIAVFMMSYKGFELKDDLAGDLACISAVGVALFPTTPDSEPSSSAEFIGKVHLVFAGVFFLTLAFFSLILFTKTGPAGPTRKKLQRNLVYRVCGVVILVAIALIAAVDLVPAAAALQPYHPVFWLESSAVVGFGVSWLIKGEALLKDDPPQTA